MWREAMGHPLMGRIAMDHEAWGREWPEQLIYPQGPVGVWYCSDIFCHARIDSRPLTSRKEPEQPVHRAHCTMAPNGFELLEATDIKADHDRNCYAVPYHNNYPAAVGAQYPRMSISASSSFHDGDDISPVVSAETRFWPDQWVPPTYLQTTQHPYTWPSAFQFNSLHAVEGYQTAVAHGLPNMALPYHTSLPYANGPAAFPTDEQTSFLNTSDGSVYSGGSFSSTPSVGSSFFSTYSASFGDSHSCSGAYPPRAFHVRTPFDRIEEVSSSPQSPHNYLGSSSSSPAMMPQGTESEAAHSSSEGPAITPYRPNKKTSSKGRKKLPDKSPRKRHTPKRSSPPPVPKPTRVRVIAPAPPSADTPRHSRNTRSNSTLASTTAEIDTPGETSQPTQARHKPARRAQLRPMVGPPAPRPALPAISPDPSPSPATSREPSTERLPTPPPPTTRAWSYNDQLLVHYRQAGMGYSQIQQLCGFKEAVSTLRGRYRTLTKPKEARVRKPAWTDKDLRLLEQGVRSLASGSSDLRLAKIPWMHVAKFIKDNGGYYFGNSTCRKRWDELFAAEVEAGKDPTYPFYRQRSRPDARE